MQEMEGSLTYKIPHSLIEEFGKVALDNKYGDKHIETLALVTGVWSQGNLIAKDLIFPKQRGTSFDVEDLGNFKWLLAFNLFNYFCVKVNKKIVYCR